MKNSAQLTSHAIYQVSENFYPGIENAIEIPVLNPVISGMENFELDLNNNLRFTGSSKSNIMVKAKFAFGGQKPSQTDPSFPLDQGPKARLYGYIQVGDQQGVHVRLDQTLYYPAFEWPFILYTLDAEDVFTFKKNDTIRFYAYYIFDLPPAPPVNPLNFYITLTKANLSIIAFSLDDLVDDNKLSLPSPLVESNTKTVPLGSGLNNEIYRFTPGVSGRKLVNLRINIGQALMYDSDRNITSEIINMNWYVYLSVNGSNDRKNLTIQTITNTPNISNGNTVWPSSLDLYLLTDLVPSDYIAVKVDLTDGLAANPANPPHFNVVTHGSVTMDLQFVSMCNKALYPNVQTIPEYNKTITLPINGTIDTAVEFPVSGDLNKFSNYFKLEDDHLIYIGHDDRYFKVHGELIISQLLLNNSNSDPAIIVLENMGFSLGVNGVKVNDAYNFNNVYSDSRYVYKWLATQTVDNILKLSKNDRISLLIWTNNIKYLNVPPNTNVVIPNLDPPAGSTITLSGKLSLIVE